MRIIKKAFYLLILLSVVFHLFIRFLDKHDNKYDQSTYRNDANSINTIKNTSEEKTESLIEDKQYIADNIDFTEDAIVINENGKELDYFIDLSDIPAFNGNPYIEINNNIPFFNDEEKTNTNTFETYSELDEYGRCGVAYANLCIELVPTEERGDIGDIRPSGWHTVKYNDLIDGNYLYNRCHLIAYRLAGENSNEKNLITGTRYLNNVGMLSFESMVGEYIEHTNNHVLYRVTPIFESDNLVASGVEMEGWSVEDNGSSICFNVYCYNVQPYIDIDYATGESCESNNSNTIIDIGDDTVDLSITEETEIYREIHEEDVIQADYIVNTNSGKIHIPTCSSVYDMAEHNKMYYSGTLDELKEMGYVPCKRCIEK